MSEKKNKNKKPPLTSERPLSEHVSQLEDDVRIRRVDLGGNVRLALEHVVGAGVVHRVRALPAEVRHQEQRVQDVSHGVLNHLVVGESAVSALVGNHPAPRAARSRHERVRDPRRQVRHRHGNIPRSKGRFCFKNE